MEFFKDGEIVETIENKVIKKFTYSGFDNSVKAARRWIEELPYVSIDPRELFRELHFCWNSYVFGPLELTSEHVDKTSIANHWTITATFTGQPVSDLKIGDVFYDLLTPSFGLEVIGFADNGNPIVSDGEYYPRTEYTDKDLVWITRNEIEGE